MISPINGMAAPRSFKAASFVQSNCTPRKEFIPEPNPTPTRACFASVISGPGSVHSAAPWAAAWSFSGTDRRLTPKLFSFAQEPIEIDGLVKILSGLKPYRIHEPRGREVCP